MIKNQNKNYIFFNKTFNKSRLKKLIYWSIISFGEKKTVDLIEILKTLGYSYATKAGLSLSIDDLKIPLIKNQLLFNVESKLNYTHQDVEKGFLTSIEYFAQLIDTWNNTNDILKQEVINNFKITDILNPVYMMAFSGARGNISQVRQLVGMRGLMADPSGRIINFPIQSNFREGLTLTEYIISCYGARKGVVDTALRTATSGYLTRRLVDVAQHVIIRIYDCLTPRGIYLTELKLNNTNKLLSLKNRLIGRILAEDVYEIKSKSNKHSFFISSLSKFNSIKNKQNKQIKQKNIIAFKNQEISSELANNLLKTKKTILVRSPLTCQDKNYVCQLCYGWGLSSNSLVSLGESVGIIAAQSIGEPGTQLTMRTFHTGGVFSGHSYDEIRAPFNGKIEFPEIINGKFVRTTHGKIAFLIKQQSFCLLKPLNFYNSSDKVFKIKKINLPIFTLLFVKQGQSVFKNQVLGEPIGFITELEKSIDIFQTIYSEFSGEVNFKKSKFIEKIDPINKQLDINLNTNVNSKIGELWLLASHKQKILKPLNIFIKKGDFIFFNCFISLYKLNYFKNNKVRQTNKNLYLISNTKLTNLKVIKKLKIFNFFDLIHKKKKLNYFIFESNLFIKYDYFHIFNSKKIKFLKKNFKQQNRIKKIYSNINEYHSNLNNTYKKKIKKTFFLPYFTKKKNYYGLQYKFLINLNPINKIIFFDLNNKNTRLPLICFFFIQYNNKKNELLEKINITKKTYFFKIPFNFILTNNFILINRYSSIKNIKLHKLNLNYKKIFKLKNFKLKKNIIEFNLKSFKKINNKKNIKDIIKKIDYNLFFFELNKYKKNNRQINSFFYNKISLKYDKKMLFKFSKYSINLYNNIVVNTFYNLIKNPSFIFIINSSLNFLILAFFYKILHNKNRNTDFSSLELLKKTFIIDKINNKNINIDKYINLNKFFNSNKTIWGFHFLSTNTKIKQKQNHFNFNKTAMFSSKFKSNYNYLNLYKNYLKEYNNLFFNNFSINIINFFKSIFFFNSSNNILLNTCSNYKHKILLYNDTKFDKSYFYFYKKNNHNLNNYNYFFLSFNLNNNFFKINNSIDKKSTFSKRKLNFNYIDKINKHFFYQSFLLFNFNKINNKLNFILHCYDKKYNIEFKKYIFEQKGFIFFKNIKNTFFYYYLNKKTIDITNLSLSLKSLINYSFYYNKLITNIKLSNKLNNKKFLYLEKEIIYISFSNYIFSIFLSNTKLYSLPKKKIFLIYKKLEDSKVKINNIKTAINTTNKIKNNLIFNFIIFYKFIKYINLIFIIYYKFLKKKNTQSFFINTKLNIKNYFFSYFSINNILLNNNINFLLFDFKNVFLDSFFFNYLNNNNLKKLLLIENFNNINYLLFKKNNKINKINIKNNDKKKNFKKLLNKKKQIEQIYFFLSEKNKVYFNISTIWCKKNKKLKSFIKINRYIKFKYYNLNNFKFKKINIKKYDNSKVNYISFFFYGFKLFTTNNYSHNKPYKKSNNFNYKIKLNNLVFFKNQKIKKVSYIKEKFKNFSFLINSKTLKKINILIKSINKNKKIKLLNNFLNSVTKYNISNSKKFIMKNTDKKYLNIYNFFEKKWVLYLNTFYNTISKNKINFELLNSTILLNNNILEFKKVNFFDDTIIKKTNINNLFIFKKYWLINYFQKNIYFYTKLNYDSDYLFFYKSNYNFYFYNLQNKKNITNLFNFKNTKEFNNSSLNNKSLNKLLFYKSFKYKIVFPIQTLYLLRIQSKSDLKKKRIFNLIVNKFSDKSFNSNNLELKYFNFKLKYSFTKYNKSYNIKNRALINLNNILNVYNFKHYKLQKSFLKFFSIKKRKKNYILNSNDLLMFNKKKIKFINKANDWFYIISESDFLFLNYKKIIKLGFSINNKILFENNNTLTNYIIINFKNKNIFYKNLFYLNILSINSFFCFKIKKNLINSLFIFYCSKFIHNYLQNFISHFNSSLFFYNIKPKTNFFSFNSNKWSTFSKFYFHKIKITNTIIKNKTDKKKNISLLNKYYRFIFFKTAVLKKINYFYIYSINEILENININNIFHKQKYFKKSLIKSSKVKKNLLNFYDKSVIIKNVNLNTLKRIFFIINLNFNVYNRYKPKLLIYKIKFKLYDLDILFNKFTKICVIKKAINFTNLNIILKNKLYKNNICIQQNDLRYFILKFPFRNNIKKQKYNLNIKRFIAIKKQKINNSFKYNYSNELFLNELNSSNIYLLNCLKKQKSFFNNNLITKLLYIYLNKVTNKKTFNYNFYDYYYLKGYKKYLFLQNNKFNIFLLIFFKYNLSLLKISFNTINSKKNKKINENNLLISLHNNKFRNFYIFYYKIKNSKNVVNYKIMSKLYLLKNIKNNFLYFNLSYYSSIYFLFNCQSYNKKNKTNNMLKYITNKVITKKSITHLINFSNKFNLYYIEYQFLKNQNQFPKIKFNYYINFKPFIIENNNFLIQINRLFKTEKFKINSLYYIPINNISNNILIKLKLIKKNIKKISKDYNNFTNYNSYKKNQNLIKNKSKINKELSTFKGEILKNNNFYSRINNTTIKQKNKNLLFPELFYLTNNDFLTYNVLNINVIKNTEITDNILNKKNKIFKVYLGKFISCSTEITSGFSITQSGQIIFLSKNKILIRRAKSFLLSKECICNLKQGDFINTNSPLLTLTYKNLKTEDIIQGIPKIEQIFEARDNLKDQLSLNYLIKLKFQNYKKYYPKKEAVHRSIIFIQQYIVDSIQKVYQSQGVDISDKHIEIIVKQMTSKVRITNPGNTGLLRGDIVYLDWIELINNRFINTKSQYEPVVLGISKACLEMDGFLSAASFQETIKILSRAAILQKRDFLRGLKENLMLGHLIPAGTGFDFII